MGVNESLNGYGDDIWPDSTYDYERKVTICSACVFASRASWKLPNRLHVNCMNSSRIGDELNAEKINSDGFANGRIDHAMCVQ